MNTCVSLRGMKSLAHTFPRHASALRPSPRRSVVAPSAAASIGDVARYISEAASRIFTPQDDSDVPWERTAGSEFSGTIAHHEDLKKLRELREIVGRARSQLQGCMDPSAANYNPDATADDGSCVYNFDEGGKLAPGGGSASAEGYVAASISRIFGHHFKGDESEPSRYYSAGYRSRARTQRDLRREVDRLARFERVVERAISKAEKEGSAP